MNKSEKSNLQSAFRDHREFLREAYKKSGSVYKLGQCFTRASVAELLVLIGLLRAVAKGAIPVSKERYTKLKATHSFAKAIQLKNDSIYHGFMKKDIKRDVLVQFVTRFMKVWTLYLHLLFDVSLPTK